MEEIYWFVEGYHRGLNRTATYPGKPQIKDDTEEQLLAAVRRRGEE